jgi:aryl-alcohol dehydrogenase-like predicted oxidoreductase
MTRLLGRSGIEVSDIGIGTWAIGGKFHAGDQPLGWGDVDDDVSIEAIRRAIDLGVTLIDTSDAYGAGHAETVIRRAVEGHRDAVVIATKWGYTFAPGTRDMVGEDATAAHARAALLASLERLGTDYIDVIQLHLGDLDPERATDLFAACEGFIDEGLIRTYGWSTDDAERAELLAKSGRGAVVQHVLNVLNDAAEMLAVCEAHDLASLNRSPLAMGLLTAKVTADSVFAADDVRGREPEWLRWFTDGRPTPEFLRRRDAIRDILTSDGRSLAQGALAWNLARSPRAIPIPGVRTVAQVEENAGVITAVPLRAEQVAEIRTLLAG